MSFLLGALSSAMPLIRFAGGSLLNKARGWVSKGLGWLANKLGGSVESGLGKTVHDWALQKMDNTFGGAMDYADNYLMKKKIPIIARSSVDAAQQMKDRMAGSTGGGGGGGQEDTAMDGVEK